MISFPAPKTLRIPSGPPLSRGGSLVLNSRKWFNLLVKGKTTHKRKGNIQIRGYGGVKWMIQKITLREKFSLFDEHWTPKIIGELNDSYVKLAKVKGEFVWHHHDNEDELFLVVRGKLTIKLRDQDISLKEGELVIIPKGTEHKPVAEDEVQFLLLEPKTTVNTGNVRNERTTTDAWI